MGKGLGIASMILGILSILFTITGFFSAIMGLMAIIFAGISMKNGKEGKGMAIAGLVTGIIGLLGSLFWALVWTAAFATI